MVALGHMDDAVAVGGNTDVVALVVAQDGQHAVAEARCRGHGARPTIEARAALTRLKR
jgi:hypothetical protein